MEVDEVVPYKKRATTYVNRVARHTPSKYIIDEINGLPLIENVTCKFKLSTKRDGPDNRREINRLVGGDCQALFENGILKWNYYKEDTRDQDEKCEKWLEEFKKRDLKKESDLVITIYMFSRYPWVSHFKLVRERNGALGWERKTRFSEEYVQNFGFQ